jgi:hypothetical protein
LPIAQIGQRNTAELTAPDGAQFAAVYQPPDGAFVIAEQARGLANVDLEWFKVRTALRLDQALRGVFDSVVTHRLLFLSCVK